MDTTAPYGGADRPQTRKWEGVLLKERYLVGSRIGSGSFGEVYLAKDTALESKPVVIKFMMAQAEGMEEWLERKFQDEIKALAKIGHHGVVGALDSGVVSGVRYLVMQYVEGESLRKYLTGKRLKPEAIANIVRQIGNALVAAHQEGVVHRDLKPENIMVQFLPGGEEHVVLIDFGIAAIKDAQSPMAGTTTIAGTYPYMAPEQFQGQPSAASDVYAFGVIAYEMVAGTNPFTNMDLNRMLFVKSQGAIPKPSASPGVPAAVDDIILRALSCQPASRYANARDFGHALADKLLQPDIGSSAVPETNATLRPEMAYVLFSDIVGFSMLPMEHQQERCARLNRIVKGATTYESARRAGQVIALPTGDGIALVFFDDPIAPLRCAVDISSQLRNDPELPLRMGIHTGLVYRTQDINANRNVTGGGINLAQRVMDCGSAGHILVSKTIAETVSQLAEWRDRLHDIGEYTVKHGVSLHLFNLYGEDFGNPREPAGKRDGVRPAKSRRAVIFAGCLALALASGGAFALRRIRQPAPVSPLDLRYSLTVQRYRNEKPFGDPFDMAGEVVLPPGDRVALNFRSSQQGHLYLFNEGPIARNGLPNYHILFPSVLNNGGSSLVAASARVRVPQQEFLKLDDQQGSETVWVVWSDRALAEFEGLQELTNEKLGVMDDAGQIRKVRDFLASHARQNVQVRREEASKEIALRSPDNMLVHRMVLEHR